MTTPTPEAPLTPEEERDYRQVLTTRNEFDAEPTYWERRLLATLDEARAALARPSVPEAATVFDEADDMCPNCVTPWKCNGPHLSEQTVAWAIDRGDDEHNPWLTLNGEQVAEVWGADGDGDEALARRMLAALTRRAAPLDVERLAEALLTSAPNPQHGPITRDDILAMRGRAVRIAAEYARLPVSEDPT